MPTLDDILQKLEAAGGDVRAQAALTAEFAISMEPEAIRDRLREALDAAVIVRWFDKPLLAHLLDVGAHEARECFDAIAALPFVERFPAREGEVRNVHDATRLGCRHRLLKKHPQDLLALSARAAEFFQPDPSPAGRIEWIYHLLSADPDHGAAALEDLARNWTGTARPEDRQALALTLGELESNEMVAGKARVEVLLCVAEARSSRGATASLGAEAATVLALARGIGYEPGLARACCLSGGVLEAQGQLAEAQAAFAEYLAISRRLAVQDPANAGWQRDLAGAHSAVGGVLEAQGRLGEAKAAYAEYLAISRRLAVQDPSNAGWQRDIAVALSTVGGVLELEAQANFSEAKAAFAEVLAISQRLAAQDPSNAGWQRDLAAAHCRMGDVLQAQGEFGEAQAAFAEYLAISRRLAVQDPTNAGWQRDLAGAHSRMGDVLQAQGEPGEAQAAFAEYLAISRRLAVQDPANAGWQRDLAGAHVLVAGLKTGSGQLTERIDHLQEAHRIFEMLVAGTPDHPGWREELGFVADELAAAEALQPRARSLLQEAHNFPDTQTAPSMSTNDTPDPKPTPDQAAAQQFLAELRTRISTQPLPYQFGVEATALKSMWEVFGHARDAMKKNPGCEHFAARATEVLNMVVRPLTAKWHRAFEEGRLNGRDGADEFRGELQNVQEHLRVFAKELHGMAYGTPHEDALTPEVMKSDDMKALFHALPFGIAPSPSLPDATAQQINSDEMKAVLARRKAHGLDDDSRRKDANKPGVPAPATNDGLNAIGLALSGGGIRSATFSLGVVQVLAERGLLKEVDFLSTVSGGGYTGCFLTQRLGNGEALADVAGPHGPDPEPVRYVRQHAKFLSPSRLKEKWAMVTATLAGTLLNLTAPLLAILVLALGAAKLGTPSPEVWSNVMISGIGLCAAAIVAYGWGMRRNKRSSLVTGGILGLLLAFTGIIGICWALEANVPGLIVSSRSSWKAWSISGAIAAVVAAVPTIVRFLPVLKNPVVRKIVLKVALLLAALLVPVIAVLLFYTFRGLAVENFYVLVVVAVLLAAVSLFVININLTAPHRLYRDSLARTFIQKSADESPDGKLADINPRGTGPYHLINAALNVPSTVDSALKDRGCDFFLFSKKWIGSPTAGYHPTGDWRANGRDVDLATAMAVSGAAFSSYMGLGSMPTLTALLTLLNVRLGFWIKKPAAKGFGAPGFTCLLQEMTGIGMSEKASWLNLSDGGHIENLAVYELLRRRCKFIICVDGESDPTFTFEGLMTVVRHAQIDFGIRIAPTLGDIRPDLVTGYSKCHYHLCRIQYPETTIAGVTSPKGVGLLLYLKLSATGNESELIRRYRTNNSDFPHQTTLDQFFDQEQFEAYRQLGVHVAGGLFMPALMSGMQPKNVPDWFRQLAKNLLEPTNA